HPQQTVERRSQAVTPGELAHGRPPADLSRVIHEHGVSARFEDAVRLAQQLVRLRVNVERMDTDDLIERLVAERVSARELAVSEGEVRQMASPPLFFRRLDERGVGI